MFIVSKQVSLLIFKETKYFGGSTAETYTYCI